VLAERRAAAQAIADVGLTSPGPAGLMARIAAARAVHADLLASAAGLAAPGELPALAPRPAASPSAGAPTVGSDSPTTSAPDSPTAGPTGSPAPARSPAAATASLRPLDPAATTALSALLSAEHAAVFAYGLLTARVADARRPAVRILWDAHRTRRDELEQRLADAGVTPPAALPAYDVGPSPGSTSALSALGARIEDAMAAAALSAVTGTTGEIRTEAAADLVHAARRASGWRGGSTALPG
jgi:hypothetical protein